MNTPQPIPEETRRLFLAAMEAEAAGFGGFAFALRDLMRRRPAIDPRWPANRLEAAKESPQ